MSPSHGRNKVPAAEEIPKPEAVQPAWGWTPGNKALFKEWEEYYRKLVQTSPVLTQEDVDSLLEQQKKRLDGQQAIEEEGKRLLVEQAAKPMARPEGNAIKESHRHNPLSGKSDGEQHS